MSSAHVKSHVSARDHVWQAALYRVEKLWASAKKLQLSAGSCREVRELLEALPLASGEFGRLANHIRNAERYLQAHEHGAAAYELRMLHGVLRAQWPSPSARGSLSADGNSVAMTADSPADGVCAVSLVVATLSPEVRSRAVSHDHSVTKLIHKMQEGQSAAQRQLWDRFLKDLVELASRRLRGVPRRGVADEEDVVLSAFQAFFQGARDGRFTRLDNRDDLWQILVMLTERKAIAHLRRELAHKRGGGKIRGESACHHGKENGSAKAHLDQVPAPSDDFADGLTLEVRERLVQLQDESLRQVALGRLAGYTVREIAAELGIGERGVARKLERIRRKWQTEDEP